jgi:hypothetical protein
MMVFADNEYLLRFRNENFNTPFYHIAALSNVQPG